MCCHTYESDHHVPPSPSICTTPFDGNNQTNFDDKPNETGRRRSISRRSLTTRGGASDGPCLPSGSRPRSSERGGGRPESGTAAAKTTRGSRPPRAVGAFLQRRWWWLGGGVVIVVLSFSLSPFRKEWAVPLSSPRLGSSGMRLYRMQQRT